MLENRPIVSLTIGYIIGIIMGLYCKISIVFIYLFTFFIYLIMPRVQSKKFKLFSFKRYFRYVKIIFTKKVILNIIFISIISNSIVLFQNDKYENLYKNLDNENVTVIATVLSNPKEKDYKKTYKIKVESVDDNSKFESTFLYLDVYNSLNIDLEYGDKIKISGEFQIPSGRTNYKGFDYKEYLKTLKIYGTVKANKIGDLSVEKSFSILEFSNSIFLKIKNLIQSNFDEESASVLMGIVLGYTDDIDENIKLNFQESNISYVLAVSGMHVGFIIIFLKIILEKLLGKRNQKIATIIILICYMFITGFAPSVVRAVIMGVLSISAGLFFRKSDIWENISLALLVLLVYNPFLIESASMWLTFLGTIGIITISVYIFTMPIMAVFFNKIAITSVIISWVIGIFIGPIFVCGFIFVIFYNVLNSIGISSLFVKGIQLLIKFVIDLTEIGSNLPLNKIYITTPSVFAIILFYVFVLVLCFLYSIYKSNNPSVFQKRVKNIISFLKFRFNQNRGKIISIILILLIVFTILKIKPGKLQIYFIDVGQGDATLIVTPKHKTILIDGGGSETRNL